MPDGAIPLAWVIEFYGGCASLPTLRDGGAAVLMPDGAIPLAWVICVYGGCALLTHPTGWGNL